MSYYSQIYGVPKNIYFKFSPKNYYSIISYNGKDLLGKFVYIYVTSHYKDLEHIHIKMRLVYLITKSYLETNILYEKYFYLEIRQYTQYSSYIYLCLEDSNFNLDNSNLKVCLTNTDPYNEPGNAVETCSFRSFSSYGSIPFSSSKKYYYKFSISSSFHYSIVSYNGSFSNGSLSVTSNYSDLLPNVLMTNVTINSTTPLSTITSKTNYFFLTNGDYSSNSSSIYICLEDNNFGLEYDDIQYCQTNTNPYSYPDSAVRHCSFRSLSFYGSENIQGSKKYYYSISKDSYYNYSIVSYEGIYPEGSLYVSNDYKSFSHSGSNNSNAFSEYIIFIAVGLLIFLVLLCILICCCCKRCRKNNKIDSIPSISETNPLNQSANNPGVEIPLQTVSYQA